MANKLRHIAISVRDPEKSAKFFEEAFGMTRAGKAQRGVYMTDGIFNVALLNFGDEPVAGAAVMSAPLSSRRRAPAPRRSTPADRPASV